MHKEFEHEAAIISIPSISKEAVYLTLHTACEKFKVL